MPVVRIAMSSLPSVPMFPPARAAGKPAKVADAAATLSAEVLDWMPTAVAAFDKNSGERLLCNRAFAEQFDAAQTARLPGFEQQFQMAATAQQEGDWQHVASGRWFAVRRGEGKLGRRAVGVIELRDITAQLQDEQRKRNEHQALLFTSKVMSIGEMAATLAHELNQPIGSMLNYLNGCLRRLERGNVSAQELHGAMIEARQQCERAAAIITRIREFVRAREPKMAPLALGGVFANVLTLLEAEIRQHRVKFALDVPEALPPVLGDRVMIEQVVHNLAKNAIEAMRQQTRPRNVRLQARVLADGMVQASVQDSGPGVPDAARAQLFSPFFTTKADGLGIGLNICRSMVEFHGGTLSYELPDEGGSRFGFCLPAATDTGAQDTGDRA
jgi:C4-dicarboxylate-specific signal transduction histidine kinase